MQVNEYTLKISKIIDETLSVKVFRAEIPADTNINFYPGQFFMVSFVDEPEIKVSRAYSVSSSPTNKEYIEIALDKVGVFTTRLFQKKEGDLLRFKGPYGKFYFSEEMKNNLVLIAGGTGLTPLMGIIRYCNDKKLNNKIKLIYSVKTPSDIIFRKELGYIKNSNKNFDYVVTVTRAEEDAAWKGERGRIGFMLLEDNIENMAESLFFLCGANEFVHTIIRLLESMGVKKEQIKTDIWG
mgnify:CR=1 FL=1